MLKVIFSVAQLPGFQVLFIPEVVPTQEIVYRLREFLFPVIAGMVTFVLLTDFGGLSRIFLVREQNQSSLMVKQFFMYTRKREEPLLTSQTHKKLTGGMSGHNLEALFPVEPPVKKSFGVSVPRNIRHFGL
jgi:hypothetical protein